MARQRYPEVPRVCATCGLAWLQRDGKPPRTYCSTTCAQEAPDYPFRTQPVAPEIPVLSTRIRRVHARLVTLKCAWCLAVAEVEQFPGPLPRYCSDACREDAQRFRAAKRMRRMRLRRLQAAWAAAPSSMRT